MPDMPPVDGAEYILGYLWEIGPTMAGGMGPAPLSHGEIRSWMQNVGIELEAWESRLLRRLSVEYIAESQAATDPKRPAPWNPEQQAESDQLARARRIKDALRG